MNSHRPPTDTFRSLEAESFRCRSRWPGCDMACVFLPPALLAPSGAEAPGQALTLQNQHRSNERRSQWRRQRHQKQRQYRQKRAEMDAAPASCKPSCSTDLRHSCHGQEEQGLEDQLQSNTQVEKRKEKGDGREISQGREGGRGEAAGATMSRKSIAHLTGPTTTAALGAPRTGLTHPT